MSTETEIRPLLDQVVEIVRTNSFLSGEPPSRAECLGIALSKYLEWTEFDILIACAAALEDCNSSEYADTLNTWAAKIPESFPSP